MNIKKFTATLFLSGRDAIKSISDRTILPESPVELACNYADHFCDMILIFDLSKNQDDHEDTLEVVEDITSVCDIPVWVAGNIMNVEDVSRIIDAGAKKAVLNFAKDSNKAIATALASPLHRDHLAAAITSKNQIIENMELLNEAVSEIIIMKDSEVAECIKYAMHPMVIPMNNCQLDVFMDTIESDMISGVFGAFISGNLNNIHSIKSVCKDRGIEVDAFTPRISWDELTPNKDGLIPVIVQDYLNNDVLMLAYMNETAFNKTVTTGLMTYYSRSRQSLWLKGETSGHFQYVKSLHTDCDSDTLLAKVSQVGAACHTGSRSCFFKEIVKKSTNI